jgi:hypothetical protein
MSLIGETETAPPHDLELREEGYLNAQPREPPQRKDVMFPQRSAQTFALEIAQASACRNE